MSEHTDCCSNPATCEQPCFHSAGRTTPGTAGAIARKPAEALAYNAREIGPGYEPVEMIVSAELADKLRQQADFEGTSLDELMERAAEAMLPQEGVLGEQVGGSHYKDMAIQPVEYIHANGLPFIEGAIVKYASRHREKGGAQDVRKIIHFARLLLKLEYGVDA